MMIVNVYEDVYFVQLQSTSTFHWFIVAFLRMLFYIESELAEPRVAGMGGYAPLIASK